MQTTIQSEDRHGRSLVTKQSTCTVGFQGERGAFSEDAIAAIWSEQQATSVALRDFTDVIEAVISQTTDFGILPVENTVVGKVLATHHALDAAKQQMATIAIADEVTIPIHHCLIGLEGATVQSLTHVQSHPVALGQCREFLRRSPWITPVNTYDTAGAAKEVAEMNNVSVAAIASVRAATIYNLQILMPEIQDVPNNHTRFIVLANTRDGRW